MEEIIEFLRALRDNNNRPWFQEHKEQYLHCVRLFEGIAARLIAGVEAFDDSVRGLQVKDCTYRIYRDIRFSPDKRPYKCHMGCYICPGGKKSGYVGYYFHIGAGGKDEGYPYGHLLAVGHYCYDPKALTTIREDIVNGDGDFDRIVRHECSPLFALDREGELKRIPAGFPADTPWGDYLRLKNLCLYHTPDDAFMTAPDVVEQTITLFRTTLPFTRYINRAISFSRTGE
jgi:uncharacterized protein (TIGR02453 family)